jgi:sec-independent protein translocase protein TatB
MFDFGFSELIVIGVVMLIVVGPERLPKVARTAGHLLGRLQRYVADVKSDIQREMQLDELKKLQEQVQQQARELESSVRTHAAEVESQLGQTEQELRAVAGPQSAATLPQGTAPEALAAGSAGAAARIEPVVGTSGTPGVSADKA